MRAKSSSASEKHRSMHVLVLAHIGQLRLRKGGYNVKYRTFMQYIYTMIE